MPLFGNDFHVFFVGMFVVLLQAADVVRTVAALDPF